jgi:PAS domain S-box-containing protein
MEPSLQVNKHQETGKIVIIYALFGCAWIYFSDTALGWLVSNPEIITRIAIFKGFLFIACTSTLLFFLIARLGGKIKKSTDALYESEQRLRFLLKNSSDSLVIINADGSQRYVSPGAERITGYPIAELEGRAIENLIHPDDWQAVLDAWNEAVAHPEKTVTVQYRHIHKTREWVFSEAIAQSFLDVPAVNGVIASVRDISERKRAEEAKMKLEDQLQQARKMEAIGQLAGGVAHDFNNMLGVILGHAEMAMEQLDPAQPLHKDLEEIRKAATRSADITRQLLAFARKQTVTPKVIDLNDTIEGMLKMLRRLIGENIDLTWLPGKGLWPVKVDPSQIDQILANLCVNARAAIAGGGKLTVETGNSTFDEEHCNTHTGFLSGEYVRIVVSDNGSGMDKETLAHIFEPFFTTKGVGEGTGLGLATVYGAIKQNSGFINAASEPGKGTTFTIYLPRYDKHGR